MHKHRVSAGRAVTFGPPNVKEDATKPRGKGRLPDGIPHKWNRQKPYHQSKKTTRRN